jgi:hypothetical protein
MDVHDKLWKSKAIITIIESQDSFKKKWFNTLG